MRRSLLAFSLLLAMAPQLARADALSDGISAVQKGDYERAIALLQRAAEANPDDPRPYAHLERAYEALYRPTDAIDAHDTWLVLTKKAAQPKPTAKPVVDEIPLPPVYVKSGPRTRLPTITNDMIPKQPTAYRATPLDAPKTAAGSDSAAKGAVAASDSEAKGAVAPPALPSPTAAPTPPPILEPILEPTGHNAPPVAMPPGLPN